MKVLKNTWRHIRRSPYQAFAAISVMTLTFIIAGFFVLLSFGSSAVLEHFETRPQIIVFFKDTKTEAEIVTLENQLKQMDKVSSVRYISKEEALSIYEEQFKNDPLLLEMVSADILPASIEVSATKIEYLSELAALLQKESDIQEIVFPKDVIDLLVSWTTTVRTVGLTLVVFLGFVSLFTVVTVISMKIALKKTEIEILQLVGASTWYIRKPFVAEGFIYGLVGALFGWSINIGILLASAGFMSSLFTGITIPFIPLSPIFAGVFLAGMVTTGSLLGVVASALAIGRYFH